MKKILIVFLLFIFTLTNLNAGWKWSATKKIGAIGVTTILKNHQLKKNSIEPTYKTLRKEKKKDAHHIIQDASVKDIKGYNRNEAPAIQLEGSSSKIGTEHYKATQEQRKSGGGTYEKERIIAYKSLRKADVPKEEAKNAVKRADTYFESIGVKLDTETRIPQNRKKQ